MANTLWVLREHASFTDDGGVVVDPSHLENLAIQANTFAGFRQQEQEREQPYTTDINDDPDVKGTASFTSKEIETGSKSSKVLGRSQGGDAH